MKNLTDILDESLLDMDEKSADKAVIDSITKKLIQNFNSIIPKSSGNDYFDTIGHEVKVGDIILTEIMEVGIVIGFGESGWSSNKSKSVYYSRDGEMYDDFDTLNVGNVRVGEFIKIPNIKILKELLKK